MSTFIQVNIYNQTLETLKMRGIDLEAIMKTIDCGDCWITEVPIHPTKKSRIADQCPEENLNIFTKEEPNTAQPLTLGDVLKLRGKSSKAKKEEIGDEHLNNLFDDWDPVLNLGVPTSAPSTSSAAPDDLRASENVNSTKKASASADNLAKLSKAFGLDQLDVENAETEVKIELNDSEAATQGQMAIIQDLLNQKASTLTTNIASAGEGSLKSVKIRMESMVKSRRQLMSEDPEITTTMYTIICSFPGCNHAYNWRVKYGKLRLLDHALTHSNTRIPCKLCGFQATNVRRMRSHYAKSHPKERVQGYGMKALVSEEQESEEDLKVLWNTCYSNYIGLIGEAGPSDGEKMRRRSRKRKAANDPFEHISKLVTKEQGNRVDATAIKQEEEEE